MLQTQSTQGERTLWERILELLAEDLAFRRDRRLFVDLRDKCGPYQKEIAELSAPEIRGMEPWLREHVVERLVDRYLAEQGRVDLLERRRASTKCLQELTPADLPAIVRADLYTAEECRKERERAEFVQHLVEKLDGLCTV
jgi:hypothetical protein